MCAIYESNTWHWRWFLFFTALHSQPGVTIQQPGYWAVPPGSNPAGTVTVTHASALSPQIQTQIQSQVCKIMIVVSEQAAWTDLKSVCACAKLWRGKRIGSRLHVRFSILLYVSVVSLPLFFHRTTSKTFYTPKYFQKFIFSLKTLVRRQNDSVLNASPFFLRKFCWIFHLECVSAALLTVYL